MRGYFGVGIDRPKSSENVGTLWRSAYQLGASFIFTIGRRYKKQCSDTYQAYRYIPLFQFGTFEDFKNSRAYDCQIFCIEFNNNSQPIKDFNHPKRCIYLLGAEDNGIPRSITELYQTIELPYVRTPSYNVAMAGTIVMYDRLMRK